MKRVFSIFIFAVLLVGLSSCARTCNRIEANGSIIGAQTGNWVFIGRSGGVITDVYILPDEMVQSESGSDGWLFLDEDRNAIHIGGDMKAIRFKGKIPNEYFEYHQEFDTCSYLERLKLRSR